MSFARHILVVEDDASLRGLFVDVISAERDHLVDSAASLAQAEALLGQPNAHYDAIVLDVGLPDGNGRDLCLKLRRRGLRIPILLLTGSVGSQDMVEGFGCGASDYLIKPVRLLELQVRLRAQLTMFDRAAGATRPVVSEYFANL